MTEVRGRSRAQHGKRTGARRLLRKTTSMRKEKRRRSWPKTTPSGQLQTGRTGESPTGDPTGVRTGATTTKARNGQISAARQGVTGGSAASSRLAANSATTARENSTTGTAKGMRTHHQSGKTGHGLTTTRTGVEGEERAREARKEEKGGHTRRQLRPPGTGIGRGRGDGGTGTGGHDGRPSRWKSIVVCSRQAWRSPPSVPASLG